MTKESNPKEIRDQDQQEQSLYCQRIRVLAQKAALDQVDNQLKELLIKNRKSEDPQT